MANSREAQLQWDISKDMTARGWKAGTAGGYGLTLVSEADSGKPHDPEKQRRAEIIDRHNDLYGAEVSDDEAVFFQRHRRPHRMRRSGVAQGSELHTGPVVHGLFPKKVTDAVLDAFSDHEKLLG
ncbi:hypothetical protein [Halomonas caseinilytica]|uniref:hypothetical protein n=1 Tax=Halomonas caseinilytica TaxID=438744 RepID=UPI0007E56039|nr:hypothetical protein [Halomonas caseinilytica]SEM37882.1 type I restriction enzyme, R subunit [Halomonas caseinilytica]